MAHVAYGKPMLIIIATKQSEKLDFFSSATKKIVWDGWFKWIGLNNSKWALPCYNISIERTRRHDYCKMQICIFLSISLLSTKIISIWLFYNHFVVEIILSTITRKLLPILNGSWVVSALVICSIYLKSAIKLLFMNLIWKYFIQFWEKVTRRYFDFQFSLSNLA